VDDSATEDREAERVRNRPSEFLASPGTVDLPPFGRCAVVWRRRTIELPGGGARIDLDAFTAFEVAGWDAKASGYDDFFGQITGRLVEPLLDAVAARRGVRLLDVATGPGYAAARAAERGASVVGVDIAEEMVALAFGLHPQLVFQVASAEALPFPDDSFDAVVANFALLHLARPEMAAAEFFRVLVPGGRLSLTVWDTPERARLFGVFLDALAEAGADPPEEIPVGPPFFRFSDEQELVHLLDDQRFKNIKIETITFSHPVSSPDALWTGLLAGTVRTSALIQQQPDKTQKQIRAAFDRVVQRHRNDDQFAIPVAVKLASATRPEQST
jgi:ubiquinone/menaquinone biosynthesis C-methylase UbiE